MSGPSSPSASAPLPIWLFGAGKMGQALIQGWRAAGLVSTQKPVHIVEKNPSPELLALVKDGVAQLEAAQAAAMGDKLVVIAVKPLTLAEVGPVIAPLLGPGSTVVSVLAGRTVAGIAAAVGWAADAPGIVRVMPNTPAAVGQGATAGFTLSGEGSVHRARAEPLLKAVGDFFWLPSEALMDAVTAVSGSGPAYVFYLTEALTQAGVKAGLPKPIAEGLARQTVVGAAALMAAEADQTPQSLREAVTSPGGTTQAALKVLMGPTALKALMEEAVEAAVKRAQELGKGDA